jgi:Chitobiase/beta-hexosaminidase C-terminal domain
MRSFVVFSFLLSGLTLVAQDANQQAIQMQQTAMQMTQDANQQAMQAAQNANQQAMQAAQNTQANSCCVAIARSPKLSLKPGHYPAGTALKMKARTRGAILYYTTDGWTPTTASTRYTGPVTLDSNTSLQVIAVAPGYVRSTIVTATYTVTNPAPAAEVDQATSLESGAPLPLVFTAPVTSKGLEVGDKLPVALASDLRVNGVVVAPKLTPVLTTVTQVDQSGLVGAPGTITFAVHSITLASGETIALSGTETMEGRPHYGRAAGLAFIPFVGMGGLLIHGEQAVIPQGATLTGWVSGASNLSASR